MYYMQQRRYRRRQARRAEVFYRIRVCVKAVIDLFPEVMGGIATVLFILFAAPILYGFVTLFVR